MSLHGNRLLMPQHNSLMPQHNVRAYLHFPGQVLVHSHRAPLAHEALGSDTSGGICFLNPVALQANDVIEVTLSTDQGHERFALKIRWSRPKGKQFLIGACMMNDADACRVRMLTQVSHIDAYRRRQQKTGRELDADTAAGEWIERHAHQVPAIN